MSVATSKAIRAALKAAGFGRADISVYNHSYSMGSTVHVKIRRAEIPLKQVEAIASKHENVHRDTATGEILGGGNTFVHVRYDDDALRTYAAQAQAQLDLGRTQFGPFHVEEKDKFTRDVWRDDDGDGVGRRVMSLDRNGSGARFVALLAAEGCLDLLAQPLPAPGNDAEPAPAERIVLGFPLPPSLAEMARRCPVHTSVTLSKIHGCTLCTRGSVRADGTDVKPLLQPAIEELVERANEAAASLLDAPAAPAVVRASSLLSPVALPGAEQHEADYLGACIDNLVNPIRDGRLTARAALERIARLAFAAGRFGH